MSRVLIVCTGNTCRSPMAEGIYRKLIQEKNIDDVEVMSMGLSAYDAEPASEYAIEAMEQMGIDIKTHKSKRIMLHDLYEADIIYVMTEHHKNILVDTLPEIESKIKVMNISDPFGQDLHRYIECRDEIMKYFENEFKKEKSE